MPKCGYCGQLTQIEHKFCPGCGKSTTTRERGTLGDLFVGAWSAALIRFLSGSPHTKHGVVLSQPVRT